MSEKLLRQNLVKCLPGFTWTPIETTTVDGVPDLNYFHRETKTEGWIELKVGPIRLRPSQVAWHSRALKEGRMAFVITRLGDELYLYQARECVACNCGRYFKITDGFIGKFPVEPVHLHYLEKELTTRNNYEN